MESKNNWETIIDPVDVALLKSELNEKRFVQNTNRGGNEIYIIDAHNSPNVMREIGRIREESFRLDGGCTGKSMDVDMFDTMEKPYSQLIVWNPDANEIIGGYRFILGPDVTFDKNGRANLATAELFDFSDKFLKDYLPHTMELGRAFVAPQYQSSKMGTKSIFSLDNLWDGIAAVIMSHPNIMYFFGKITLHPQYDRDARNLLIHFMDKHFHDNDELVIARKPSELTASPNMMNLILKDEEFKQDYLNLKEAVRLLGSYIPPLFNSYMVLSPTMRFFGLSECHDLIGAEEAGILICFDEMDESKRSRHVKPFIKNSVDRIMTRYPQNDATQLAQMLADKHNKKRLRMYKRFIGDLKK